jgi:enoyl-CoA hydratase
MEMVMTGEMIDANEAYRVGLVNHVCSPEDLREYTLDMARLIGSKSSNTLRVGKQTIRSALDVGLSEGVAIEAEAFASLFDSKDKEIGVSAFLNRETPQWEHK